MWQCMWKIFDSLSNRKKYEFIRFYTNRTILANGELKMKRENGKSGNVREMKPNFAYEFKRALLFIFQWELRLVKFFSVAILFFISISKEKGKSISKLLQHLACEGAVKIRAPYLSLSLLLCSMCHTKNIYVVTHTMDWTHLNERMNYTMCIEWHLFLWVFGWLKREREWESKKITS